MDEIKIDDIKIDEMDNVMVASINNFLNGKLLSIVKKDAYIFSPFSLSYTFMLLYLGLTGKSRDELANLFGIDVEDIKYNENLIKLMIDINHGFVGSSLINIKNSIFIADIYYKNIQPLFLKLLDKTLTVRPCHFFTDSKNVCATINQWISAITNNIANDTLRRDDITRMTQMMIINVINIKSIWKYRFTKLDINVKGMPFIAKDGTKIALEYLHQENKFHYFENREIQLIEIPFIDDNFVFGVILSNSNQIMNKYHHFITQMRRREINLYLPKFTQIGSLDIMDCMKNLSVSRIFNIGEGDFGNMIENIDGLFIDQIKHIVVLSIDEMGDEREGLAVAKDKVLPILFRADKPFQYYIRHLPTDTIILSGLFDGGASADGDPGIKF